MSRFLQLHMLTFFPPSNLNRDDTGRPKTAIVGDTTRLRLSSQSLKRAWRTSDVFGKALEGHIGQRTQRFGDHILADLLERQIPPERARSVACAVASVFGKLKEEKGINPTQIEQLAFIAPEERDAAFVLARSAAADGKPIDPKKLGLLRTVDTAADIALFGRMLADNPGYNREAAAQVAHAITTHRVTVEDDYYTAVDDLKRPSEDAGAAFVGEASFGSGVFYLYLCIDRALLVKNLGGDAALAATAIAALVEAAATTAPSGKQNSFAAHGRAHYVLAERGDVQPRTLAGAFAKAVTGADLLDASVAALIAFRSALDAAYGPAAPEHAILHVGTSGTLAEIVAFARA